MSGFLTRPDLAGTFGAVSSTHWIATSVGMRILELGGNAFDASVAMGFTLQVVEPHLNGPGGDAPILACRATDDEPTVICGQGGAPAAATVERFEALGLDLIPGTGMLAPCVPGAFGAWLTLLRDWGTLSLREVLEPAIYYARSGHPLLASAAHTIGTVRDLFLSDWRTSADVFLDRGAVPEAGELFANPALADFYGWLLDQAEQAGGQRDRQIEAALAFWYEGPVAEIIDKFSRSFDVLDVSGRYHKGLITGADLYGWRPSAERPLSVDHGQHTVFKCGPWSQGPVLLQCLRILEADDLASMRTDDPEYIHIVVEALKLAMADRDAYYGDEPTVPIEHLLSSAYGRERRAQIGREASHDLRPGQIEGYSAHLPRISARPQRTGAGSGEPTMAKTSPAGAEKRGQADFDECQVGDTCHIDVIDRWGNMVSATPSGGWLQSNPIIPGLGFALGTRMQMFWLDQNHPNGLKPGKRPRTTLTPSMAFRRGEPYLAFGTPGGDQQEQWSLQLFLSHVHHRKSLQAAIDAPAMHTDHLIGSFWPRKYAPGSLFVESRYPLQTIVRLRELGHLVTVGDDWSEGRLSACSRSSTSTINLLRGAANPRGMQGYALVR